MSGEPGPVPPPLCKAILMCREVEIDRGTGTYNLLGVLDGFELRTFPGSTPPFTVFLLLTGSQGTQEVWAEVYDLRDGQSIGRSPPIPVRFTGRAEMVFVRIALPPLSLPAPGEYDLVVFSGDGEIDRLVFIAVAPEE